MQINSSDCELAADKALTNWLTCIIPSTDKFWLAGVYNSWAVTINKMIADQQTHVIISLVYIYGNIINILNIFSTMATL